ncbi:MAG: hypothetical protein ACYTGZ_13220 [Planctomycetota bacterium]|jgi:hypothetical protein
MRDVLLVAVAAAAVGAASALFFSRPTPAPVRTVSGRDTSIDIDALEIAFRRALLNARFSAASNVPSDIRPHETESTSQSAEDTDAEATVSAGALPPAHVAVLEKLTSFADDGDLRRSWILRSERAVIEWLGTPDTIVAIDGNEEWSYPLRDGSVVRLTLHRGRLLDLWRVE